MDSRSGDLSQTAAIQAIGGLPSRLPLGFLSGARLPVLVGLGWRIMGPNQLLLLLLYMQLNRAKD